MNRTALILLLTASIFLSRRAHAQQVSFSGNAVKLETFFSAVSKQTGYVFFYNASYLKDIPPSSIELKNVSLDSAIRFGLKNRPFTYSIQGKTIFVRPTVTFSTESSSEQLLGNKIRGRVVDQFGLAVSGASVYSKDAKNAAVTNEKGDFQLRINKGDSLLISCIGYGKLVIKPDSSFVSILLQYNTAPLDQVIIGGNLFATKRKSDISSVTVIDSKMLQTLPVTDIAEIYRGLVPGTNSFSVGDQPQGFPSLTIRGAGSETSLTEIGVYIDGVQLAGGSTYLSTLNKENIDRIEILRGPESSTLYGTGSNGGVVQIFTKKGVSNSDILSATASAGFIQSKWVPSTVFQQYYTLDKQISFKNTSLIAGGTYQSNGAWLPGGGGKTGTAHLNLKWDAGKKISVDLTGYYAGTNSGVSRICVFDTCIHLSPDTAQYYSVFPRKLTNKETEFRSYFAAINLVYLSSDFWTHRLTLGFSQNDYHDKPVESIDKNGLVPDNFYHSLNKTTTIRYSNILRLGKSAETWGASIMSGAEYKNIFYEAEITGSRGFILSGDPPNTNLGLFSQVNASYKNVYLTAGLRYDYNKLFANNHSLNPRIGLTTNFSFSGLMIKPRISWGSGITAPSYEARYGFPPTSIIVGVANPAIKPQQQSGFDYGLEFYDRKNRFSGEIVYYDNTMKNMFAQSELPMNGGMYVFQYTNIGEVANRGWEFSGRYHFNKRISLYGSFSIMHSVITDTTGDYLSSQLAGRAPGYQLKYLPVHTAGLFVTYQFFRLFRKQDNGSLSLNVTELDGVYSYDGVKQSIDQAYGRAPAYNGTLPEEYWVSSGTLFKLGIHFEYSISGAWRFFAQGSNILNRNTYEISSYNPTHGSSWLFGFKFSSGK